MFVNALASQQLLTEINFVIHNYALHAWISFNFITARFLLVTAQMGSDTPIF